MNKLLFVLFVKYRVIEEKIMMSTVIVRSIHFIAIFLVVASVFAELCLIDKKVSRKRIKQLAKIDGLYGIASIVVVGAGFLLWFVVGKDASFYSGNMIFYSKIALFSVVGVLSLVPTVFFMKNKKGNPLDEVEIPKRIKNIVVVELILLLAIPFLASSMAAGVGL